MNQYLNINRLLLISKKDFFSARRQLILAPLTIGAFILLIGLISGNNSPVSSRSYNIFFSFIMYTGGLITTASIFRDRHNHDSIHSWLMLPASTLEKYIVRFLFSTIGIIFISLVTVWFSSLITSLCNWILYGQSFSLFNPFVNINIWHSIQGYMAVHAFFFLGATWFRKNNFIKTVLTLLILQILLSIIGSSFGYMFLVRSFINNSDTFSENFFFKSTLLSGRHIALIIRTVFQLIIPTCCLVLAYFKLKKAEVKDGV